jgi:hypothetical protein
MGAKKTLREVLCKHPDLFDLVIMLAEKDDIVASEEKVDDQTQVVLGRAGKKKKKQFIFTKTKEGYNFSVDNG